MIVAAFLRGMNLGNRRITNADLRAQFERLGFESVATFQAAGNVVFEAGEASERRARRDDREGAGGGSRLRGADAAPQRGGAAGDGRRRALPRRRPRRRQGKLQVLLLAEAPKSAERDAVLAHATDDDRLAFGSRELFWLPSGRTTDSDLDLQAIEKQLRAGGRCGPTARSSASSPSTIGAATRLRPCARTHSSTPSTRSSKEKFEAALPSRCAVLQPGDVPLLRRSRPRRHDPHRGPAKLFEDFEYVHTIESPDEPVAALIFRTRVGDRWMDGLDLLSFDDDGLITEMKVMLRPKSGVDAMAAAMGKRFEELGLSQPSA